MPASADEFSNAYHQFGPNSANATIDDLAIGASVLLPSTGSNGSPAAVVNNQVISQFDGGVVEFKPGSALSQAASQAVGVALLQCEYTKWGLWAAETSRPGQNISGGPVRDRREMFWVAGRLPANAQRRAGDGQRDIYWSRDREHPERRLVICVCSAVSEHGQFRARTGNVTINGLDGAQLCGAGHIPRRSALLRRLSDGAEREPLDDALRKFLPEQDVVRSERWAARCRSRAQQLWRRRHLHRAQAIEPMRSHDPGGWPIVTISRACAS